MAKIGIIGGSGLGDALCGDSSNKSAPIKTPFGMASDGLVETSWSNQDVVLLNRHGPGHTLDPTNVNYRANIYALKAAGCSHVIASCAVGSLREPIAPKHLVVPDQIIDKTSQRKGTFFDKGLAAHIEFASPFCPVLRKHLLNCAESVETKVHAGGTYICMEGPAFSTRAESEMHRLWGGDLIGMTAMPEARLAREAELSYALLCLPSDYDCWKPMGEHLDKHELLKEIISNLTEATANAITLIKSAISRFSEIENTPCSAHSALELAIWTNPNAISQTTKDYYNLITAKYL